MREVVIKVSCDECDKPMAEDDAEVVKVEHAGVTYEGDFCAGCLTLWTAPLRPVPKTKKQCEDCDRAFTTQQGLTRHRNKVHGI